MAFEVYVDDNFHYQDESERYKLGEYDSYDEALAAATGIVDRFLQENCSKHRQAEELLSAYKMFGDDPFIVPDTGSDRFSAWDYAKQQAEQLYSER